LTKQVSRTGLTRESPRRIKIKGGTRESLYPSRAERRNSRQERTDRCRVIRSNKKAYAHSLVDRSGAAAQNPAKGATVMKASTKDKAEGKFHEMKGKVKEKVGQLTNNPGLEAEGTVEKAAGKVQGIIGQVEKALEQ